MPDYTTKLNLAKPNTTTEPNNTFNLDTYLNDNWEKIDDFADTAITTDKLINNLAATSAGFGLDARQGKAIGDRLTTAEGTIIDHTAQLLKVPFKTTSNIAYYVNATSGSDSNDGLTSGTAFKTIQYALNKIPQIINNSSAINLSPGNYNEDLVIQNFIASGLSIIGGNGINTTYNIKSITILNCSNVTVTGINITTTTSIPLQIGATKKCNISYINSITSESLDNILVSDASNATISNCTLSNHTYAIRCAGLSQVYSDTNSGNSNTYGLVAQTGGTIIKNSTQPAGTTAELTQSGGLIR